MHRVQVRHKTFFALTTLIILLSLAYISFRMPESDSSRAERICAALKYQNQTHTHYYPALDSDLMTILTEGNIRLDEIEYVGVDQIVGLKEQVVARCAYHVRKCVLMRAIYRSETNSTDFLCSDLSLLVGVKESEVKRWRSGLA